MELVHCRHFQQRPTDQLRMLTGRHRGKRKARSAVPCHAVAWREQTPHICILKTNWAVPSWLNLTVCLTDFSRRVRCFLAIALHARAHLWHFPSTHHISLMQYTCSCLLTLSVSFHVFSPSVSHNSGTSRDLAPFGMCPFGNRTNRRTSMCVGS